jgi:hypothetical protein
LKPRYSPWCRISSLRKWAAAVQIPCCFNNKYCVQDHNLAIETQSIDTKPSNVGATPMYVPIHALTASCYVHQPQCMAMQIGTGASCILGTQSSMHSLIGCGFQLLAISWYICCLKAISTLCCLQHHCKRAAPVEMIRDKTCRVST